MKRIILALTLVVMALPAPEAVTAQASDFQLPEYTDEQRWNRLASGLVSLVVTASEKNTSASSPASAPMPTAATNSSAHNRSGIDLITLFTSRSAARRNR